MLIKEKFDLSTKSLSSMLAQIQQLPPVVNPEILDIEFLGNLGNKTMFDFAEQNLTEIIKMIANNYYQRWIELHELFERNLNTPKDKWEIKSVSGTDTETRANTGTDTIIDKTEVYGYNDSSAPADKEQDTKTTDYGHTETITKEYGQVITKENENYNKEIVLYMQENLNLYDIIISDISKLLCLSVY